MDVGRFNPKLDDFWWVIFIHFWIRNIPRYTVYYDDEVPAAVAEPVHVVYISYKYFILTNM